MTTPNCRVAPARGTRYLVRERLGRGAWKEAFRAVQTGGNVGWRDVALLRYVKRPDTDTLRKEVEGVYLMMVEANPKPEHLTQFLDYYTEEGDPVLVQELLYRALDRLSPLRAAERYLRISRDLFKGLAELHALGVMHRDLKLDNCGVDYNDSAKLFDLSLATNVENVPSRGTVYTLAPELCQGTEQYTKPADVWALGATLFALRTGEYPHMTKAEVQIRRGLNPEDLEDREKREEIATEIMRRRTEPGAEGELRERVESLFPSSLAERLCSILQYDPSERPTAAEAAKALGGYLQQWLTPRQEASSPSADYEVLVAQLKTILRRGAVSLKQWQRACSIKEQLEEKLTEQDKQHLDNLFSRVNELRSVDMVV